MFDQHQKIIDQYAKQRPDNMARVMTFVLATVQQSLFMVPDIMTEIDKQGASSQYLWGWKMQAFDYITDNQKQIFDETINIFDAYPNPDIARHELLKYFAMLPGFGLVKGGFCCQLIFGLSGCLDSHNIKRFGLKASRFSAARFKNARSETLRNDIVKEYHGIVDALGGSCELWNSWCEYVAENAPTRYNSVYEVSRWHLIGIGLET